MNIKQILKELEKEKDKVSYLKKIIEKIKNKKLKEQIEKLIEELEKKESLEERISDNAPIQKSSVMHSLQEEAFEIKEYKAQPVQQAPIFMPRLPEDFEKENIYKQKPFESYHTGEERNPIRARLMESYEEGNIGSTISSHTRQQIMSNVKDIMSENRIVESLREMEDKLPEYTTGVSQLEEDTGLNQSKKKKHKDYQ